MVLTHKFTDCWNVRKKGTNEIYLVFNDNIICESDNKRYVLFKRKGKEYNDFYIMLFSEFEPMFKIV